MENTGPRKYVHFLPGFRTISSSISRIDGSFREITKTEGFPVAWITYLVRIGMKETLLFQFMDQSI